MPTLDLPAIWTPGWMTCILAPPNPLAIQMVSGPYMGPGKPSAQYSAGAAVQHCAWSFHPGVDPQNVEGSEWMNLFTV